MTQYMKKSDLSCTNFLSRKQNKMFMVVLDPDAGFKYDMEINPVVTGKYPEYSQDVLPPTAVISC